MLSKQSVKPVMIGAAAVTAGAATMFVVGGLILRRIKGETSAEIESFSDGETLEFPQYTKPADFNGMKVPEVLLSGNHGAIAKWRTEHSKKAEK